MYKRQAKERTNNEHDRARLIWFALTKKLYDKGAVPDDVIHVFKKYMKYFEDNLDNFDVTL